MKVLLALAVRLLLLRESAHMAELILNCIVLVAGYPSSKSTCCR